MEKYKLTRSKTCTFTCKQSLTFLDVCANAISILDDSYDNEHKTFTKSLKQAVRQAIDIAGANHSMLETVISTLKLSFCYRFGPQGKSIFKNTMGFKSGNVILELETLPKDN